MTGCTRCGSKSVILIEFKAGDTPFYLCPGCTMDFERFLKGYVISMMVKEDKE